MIAVDPRIKIFSFFLYAFLIFMHNNLPSQLLLAGITILIIFISRQQLSAVLKKIKYLLYFLPLTFLIHLLFSTSLFAVIFSRQHFDYQTLAIPFIYTFRIGNFLIFTSWFTGWIETEKVLDGIYLILKPLKKIKVPVDNLFQVIFIAIRFFPILQQEYQTISASWKTYSNQQDNENRLINIMNMLISLLVFSFRKAEKIALAMHVRGYGQADRSYYTTLQITRYDLLVMSFNLLFFMIMLKVGGSFATVSV